MTGSDPDEHSDEMYYIMMIDTMAERYGLLPSEVYQRATTVDLYVLQTAIGYRNRKNNPDQPRPAPKLTESQMQAMIDRVKKENK